MLHYHLSISLINLFEPWRRPDTIKIDLNNHFKQVNASLSLINLFEPWRRPDTIKINLNNHFKQVNASLSLINLFELHGEDQIL